MEGHHNISQYRSRLAKTLASPDLENEDTLKSLIRHQMLQSSETAAEECIENVVGKRTKDVSNLLGMLRSASVDTEELKGNEAHHGGWKLKQDTHEYRVMYREGQAGTPFHTLLVEGYVDGPMDHCLCVSWEADLYKKWWPHFNVPTFKVVASECVKRVRVGEDICLVRMKVSWPLSSREALLHFVEFEYLQDDLVIVLLNSISDLESIERSTHGFTRDGIPDVQNVVRIDVVGGYCLQKVSANRSYFRTIANMDIKLDFIPPSLINFISRQLVGSGFKLYQKEVTSLPKGDKDFSKALKEPLYTRIRETLYSNNTSNGDFSEPVNLEASTIVSPERETVITMENEVSRNDQINYSRTEGPVNIEKNGVCEIEEVEESQDSKEDSIYGTPINEVVANGIAKNEKSIRISSEVERALGTLEKVISLFREYGVSPQTLSLLGLADKGLTSSGKEASKVPGPLESQMSLKVWGCSEVSLNVSTEKTSDGAGTEPNHGSRCTGNIFSAKDAKDNRIAPASSPEEDTQSATEARLSSFSFSKNQAAIFEKAIDGELMNHPSSNGIDESIPKRKKRKSRFCCLHFPSGRLIS